MHPSHSDISIKIDKSNSQYAPISCDFVDLEPMQYIKFICTQFQTSATLHIHLRNNANQNKNIYGYRILCSNKKGYQVASPTGRLTQGKVCTISINLRHTASIHLNLRDKFIVQVYLAQDQSTANTIFRHKLAISIESGITKIEHKSSESKNLTNNNTQFSQFMSSLSSASLPKYSTSPYTSYPENQYEQISSRIVEQARSGQKDIVEVSSFSRNKKQQFISNLGSRKGAYTSQQIQFMKLKQQDQKRKFGETINQIDKRNREISLLQTEFRSAQARARFTIYQTFFYVIFAIILAVLLRAFNIHNYCFSVVSFIFHKINGEAKQQHILTTNPQTIPNQHL